MGASYQLAQGLASAANDVTVFLVQNGVLPARAGSDAAPRLEVLASSARALADDFSLRERGMGADELAGGVSPASIDVLVGLVVEDGHNVIWH